MATVARRSRILRVGVTPRGDELEEFLRFLFLRIVAPGDDFVEQRARAVGVAHVDVRAREIEARVAATGVGFGLRVAVVGE